MEKVDAPDTNRTDGVSVISFGEREKSGFPLILSTFLLPILECNLERDFYGC